MAGYIARRKFLATLLGGAAAWPLAEPVARQPTAPPDSSMIARIPSAAAFR
jgi:hypothetical protein